MLIQKNVIPKKKEKRNNLTYVLIHTPDEVLLEIAEKMRHKVPLAVSLFQNNHLIIQLVLC